MYFIFNKQGLVKYQEVEDIILQHSNDVNQLFIAIEERDNNSFTCSGNFKLPNEEIVPVVAIPETFTFSGVQYKGWRLPLLNTVTLYNGTIQFSGALYDSGKLFTTFTQDLTVNPAIYPIDVDYPITEAQYRSLLETIGSMLYAKDTRNTFQYNSLEEANLDLDNIIENNYVLVNINDDLTFYRKINGVLIPVSMTNGIKIINITEQNDLSIMLTEFASKMELGGVMYLGIQVNSGKHFEGFISQLPLGEENQSYSITHAENLYFLVKDNSVIRVIGSTLASYILENNFIVDKQVGFSNGAYRGIDSTDPGKQYATLDEVDNVHGEVVQLRKDINADLEDYVAIDDIVDDLYTRDANRPLSARQGVVLKDLINQFGAGILVPKAVQTLPTLENAVLNTLYFVIPTGEEWLCFNNDSGIKQLLFIGDDKIDLSNYYNKSEVNSLLLDKQNALDMTSYVVTLQQVSAEVANLYQEGRINSSYLINAATTDYGNVLFAVEENDNEVYEFTVIASGTMYRVTYDFNTLEYNIYPLTIGGETNVVVDITNTPYTYSTLTGFQDNDILTIDTRGRESDNMISLSGFTFTDSQVQVVNPNEITFVANRTISGDLILVSNDIDLPQGFIKGETSFSLKVDTNISWFSQDYQRLTISFKENTAALLNFTFSQNKQTLTVPDNANKMQLLLRYNASSSGQTLQVGDTITFKDIYIYQGNVDIPYEPYGESTNVEVYDRLPSSVLGQQDIGKDLSTNVQNYTVCLNDSSFSVGFTSTNRKLVNIVKDRRYFAISNAVTQEHSTTHYSLFYSLSYAGLSTFKSRLTIDGYWCSIMQANETTSEAVPGITAGFGNVLNGQVNFMVLIDLNEYGLENLTAQQVYDLLKDNLDLIASGANVSELVGTVKGTNTTQITFTGHIGHQLEFRSLNGVNVDFTQTKLTYHEYVSTELIGLLTEQLENLNVRVSELEKENTDIKLELVEIRSILTNKADIGVNTIFKLASVNNELLLVENDIQVNENILIVPETNNFDFVRNLLVPLSFNAGQVVDLNIYVNTLSSNSRLNYNVTATIIKRVGGVDTVMGEATIVVYTQNNTYRSFIASILIDNATTLNVGEQLVVRLRSSDDTLVLLTGNEDEKSYLKYTQ